MDTAIRTQLAFRLTGLEEPTRREAGVRDLRPALMARVQDLAKLRYDFPVVLLAKPVDDEFAHPLTTVVDRALASLEATGADAQSLRNDVIAVEQAIRALVAKGKRGRLLELWDAASNPLTTAGGEAFRANVARGRAALKADGELVDCDREFAAKYLSHAWTTLQHRKNERFHAEVDRLILALSEILDADSARSRVSFTPDRLRQSIGNAHRDAFDFNALARVLRQGSGRGGLSESRARRIHALVAALESQRFFLDASGYRFEFHRCRAALTAFRNRLPAMAELARSVAMARLEVEGRYVEPEHDPFFQHFSTATLGRKELAEFPDYLVHLGDGDFDALEQSDLTTLLCMGAPVKVLVQSDDLIAEVLETPSLSTIGARSQALTGMAMGLGDVFVLQSSASNLPALGARVMDALSFAGPALFNVYSGAGGETGLPAYLNAAAAMESRAFPAFSFDPARDEGEKPAFSLENNVQAESAWPVHSLEYEDASHQRRSQEIAFTIADFLAADARLSRFFLDVPGGEGVASVAEWLDGADALAQSPGVKMVDGRGTLHDLVIGDPVIGQTRRARDRFARMRRLANPPTREVAAPSAPAAEAPTQVEALPAAPQPAAPAPEAAAPSSDEAYVETPRCTTCEECMQVNNRLFK
ncbi:MAG: hypothetical protein ACM3X5_05550, partial [Bacillota bacterium]